MTAALWTYRMTFKVITEATPFSWVYGIEATLPIEYEVESLKVVINSPLTDSESLREGLTTLQKLDVCRRLNA